MPNATVRANARTMPKADLALRARLAAAAERIIDALDALDAADEDLEDGHDREEDPAESGIADDEGYREQLTGEPSLGATNDIDQAVAWGPDRLRGVLDGEATGTVDDIAADFPYEARLADRAAASSAGDQARQMAWRKRARSAKRAGGYPIVGIVR